MFKSKLIMLLALNAFTLPTYAMDISSSEDSDSREEELSSSTDTLEDAKNIFLNGLKLESECDELINKITQMYMKSINEQIGFSPELLFSTFIENHRTKLNNIYDVYDNILVKMNNELAKEEKTKNIKLEFNDFVKLSIIAPAKKLILKNLIKECKTIFETVGMWQIKSEEDRENKKKDQLEILEKIANYNKCFMDVLISLEEDIRNDKLGILKEEIDDSLLNTYAKDWEEARALLKVRLNRITTQDIAPRMMDLATKTPRGVLEMIFQYAGNPTQVRPVCKRFYKVWAEDKKNTKGQMILEKEGIEGKIAILMTPIIKKLKVSTKKLEGLMNETTSSYYCTVYKCDFEKLLVIFNTLKDEVIKEVLSCIPPEKLNQPTLENWIAHDVPDTLRYIFLLNQLLYIQNHNAQKSTGLGEWMKVKESRTQKVLNQILSLSKDLGSKEYQNDILNFIEVITKKNTANYRTQEMIDTQAQTLLEKMFEKFMNEVMFPKSKKK